MKGSIFIVLMFVANFALTQTTGIVYFNFKSVQLRQEAKVELNRIASGKNITALGIFGHTDQVGTETYNEWLSLQRARVVRDYLLSRGFSPANISVVLGFGTSRLISNNVDELSRQQNRRVVLMNAYKPTRIDLDIAAQQALLTKPVEAKDVAANNQPKKEIENPNTPLPVQPAKAEPPVKREQPVVRQQKNEKLVEDIQDKSVRAGEHIVLRNINFHPGKNLFLENAYPALQDLLEAMQKIKTLQVEIQGHVCCTEDEGDALDVLTGVLNLSVTRAKAVHDYLVQKGIEQSRISFKGLAHQYPLVAIESTEEDRIANRRVEIKIIKK